MYLISPHFSSSTPPHPNDHPSLPPNSSKHPLLFFRKKTDILFLAFYAPRIFDQNWGRRNNSKSTALFRGDADCWKLLWRRDYHKWGRSIHFSSVLFAGRIISGGGGGLLGKKDYGPIFPTPHPFYAAAQKGRSGTRRELPRAFKNTNSHLNAMDQLKAIQFVGELRHYWIWRECDSVNLLSSPAKEITSGTVGRLKPDLESAFCK